MRDQTFLDKLAPTLREYPAGQSDVVASYIFGLMAQGRARPGSDVDVAVLLSEGLDAEARFMRRLRLGAEAEDAIGARTDLVVLNDAPPLLWVGEGTALAYALDEPIADYLRGEEAG